MIAAHPAIDELIGLLTGPPPVEVVRPADLVHLTFSFVNLRLESEAERGVPVLRRRARNRPAFLIVDCHAQHITEAALFEVAPNYQVRNPQPPFALPPGTTPPHDPDVGRAGFDLTNPASVAALPPPPIFASLAGSSRLVFKVTSQVIPYTIEELVGAMSVLDLSVAPQAVPPQKKKRVPNWLELLASEAIDLSRLLAAADAPVIKTRRAQRRVEASDTLTRVTAELIGLGRMQATARTLEYRFGLDPAVAALAGTRLGEKLGFKDVIAGIDVVIPREIFPPLPAPPATTETCLELPWRLQISPNEHGAFAHSRTPVEHDHRVELWHTRLGVRRVDEQGQPSVDELAGDLRTVRAIWARDYEILPVAHGNPKFQFTSPPTGQNFPNANSSEDRPLLHGSQRWPLNSRDRMMLVHETANFHLKRTGPSGRPRAWSPEAVPTNRLMLTALGGWLDSRVLFDSLPDGGLTVEEWKHRAAMGRDDEVKVVYAGFLMPFGHRASLVKITERKFASGPAGPTAYLFQRMFIIVREPQKQFRNRGVVLPDGRNVDLIMPLSMVRILTSVTPPLDPPQQLSSVASGYLFMPRVAEANFLFKIFAVDVEHNQLEFEAPLVFMERDYNDTTPNPNDPTSNPLNATVTAYNKNGLVERRFDLRGQKVAYADSEQPDDTTLATQSMTFQVVTSNQIDNVPQDEPRFLPILEEAKTVVPAMSALTGAATPTRVRYQQHFARRGFVDNSIQAFLEFPTPPPMTFAGQGDRSGGFVTPSMNIKALSRLTGPISGDIDKAVAGAADFNLGTFFEGISAKLFGLIELPQLLRAVGFDLNRMPKFVTQTLDIASTLQQNAERVRNAAFDLQGQAGQLGAMASKLKLDIDALLADLTTVAADPTASTPPDLAGDLTTIAADLDPFIDAVNSAPDGTLPRPAKEQLVGMAQRIKDQLEDAAATAAAAQALIQFAQGLKLPEVLTARLDWTGALEAWPASGNPSADAIFLPLGPGNIGKLTLAVEVQAPTRQGKPPSALVSCSLSPFDLQLIAPAKFITLHFKVLEFSIVPGKKADVNVEFGTPGITFDGPLEFVNRLKDIIPFDGFSDPPYLDVTAQGVNAGFDLAIPDLAVGVFALSNVALGAQFRVPFIDESIETKFNFCTRENPFRLAVALFAGGGFFGIVITPKNVRVLEAAFEFGAAIEVNFGVASGGVSVMAGIYFKLETDTAGHTKAQLTGYFRLRGEVDVLGLISASIELYLDFTYEPASGKAVGRATITVEVEIAFFSTSVSISCEKKFAGSKGDPSFTDVMGLAPSAPPGATRPWDVYCHAFADE